MNKNNAKVTITDAFIALPEIQEVISKYKHTGFTVVVCMQLILLKYKHGIGRISHAGRYAAKMGVKTKTLLRIMDDCCAFVMDYEHDICYMPRLRKKNRLPVTLTEEEINDVCCNGNVYFGYGENVPDGQCAYGKKSVTFREHSENEAVQDADSQTVPVYAFKDKDISGKDIDKDKRKEDDALVCSDADVDEFKNILSFRPWCRSVKKRYGVDLGDSTVLGIFAQWMYDYCCAGDKTLKGRSDLRQYASNLLKEGSETRRDFDRYRSGMAAGDGQDGRAICYESMRDNVRYSCEGQMIPDGAPAQPSPEVSFSYAQNRWIPSGEYDVESETEAFRTNVRNIPGYIKGLGGAL